ncbi:MAG: hypothetical protein A2140_05700 [Candidatus Muproteobacteria bacterium RBG_16_62_13]|uniref:O-antigen ligase-related domain-containing protein n=1 Tax=Candidatus Muproteobacteria bacterium RBG_16_62_13 TaxID=1817756 RepID=A0A1F6T7J4_9PROT|nr:MAG: hypothetical protein A2140_05700 [Candidatus Muproteobacteria bacterium RBG_16_62_13]
MTMLFPAPGRGRSAAWLPPLLFASSAAAAVFFQGFEVGLFCISLTLLFGWLLWTIWRGHGAGFNIPRSAPALFLTLFWLWLGITLLWTPVIYVSVFDFWWLGALPLVFWIYTLAPDKDRIWPGIAGLALMLVVALALTAIFQFWILHQSPRSVFLNINSHAGVLNIVALPAAGYFLAGYGYDRYKKVLPVLATAFFLLVYAVALTRGRGAMISLLTGLAMIVAVAARRTPKKATVILLILATVAIGLANVSWQGQLAERIGTLSSPMTAGSDRFIIWRQAWEMIQASPWLGTGLGTFSLIYPQYRDPKDTTAGFFVHSDYLQLWLETGLPGLLLLAALLLSVLWLYVIVLRRADISAASKIEMTGLFSGLFAVALHSSVDFNFYVLVTTIIGGVMLGRFHELAAPVAGIGHWHIRPAAWMGARAYRTIAFLLVMFPLVYFGSISLSIYETDKGLEEAKQGRLEEADRSFARAHRIYPYADNILISHADLYRHILRVAPGLTTEKKSELFAQASSMLVEAERLNPLRPLNFLVRGRLYQENPTLIGENGAEKIGDAYRQALKLNPRFYHARAAYGAFLATAGRTREARQILEEGLRYQYIEHEEIAPYYALTAKLRLQAGDKEGAAQLWKRMEGALESSGWRRIPLPEKAGLLGAEASGVPSGNAPAEKRR